MSNVKRCVSRFFAALMMLLVVGAGSAAGANTWFVDGNVGSDGNSCTAPGLTACRTIQVAINKASSGDTIIVAAALYPESATGPLTVNKTLILQGAQATVDARTRVGPESIVGDSQGTFVSANNVTLDGFTFANSTNGAFTGYGVLIGAGTTGAQILNNIVQNNIIGIGVGGSATLIEHNLIQNNNQTGPSSGTGIYTDEFVSGGSLSNVNINANSFRGNADAGIDVSNTGPGVFGLIASANSFDANGRALVLFNTHNSTIIGNSITTTTDAASAAIRLFDNNTNLAITLNDLIDGAGHAIRLSFLNLVGSASSQVVINQNNIGVVGPLNFAGDGLRVSPGGHVGTVDATCNWWGSPTGPTNVSNPGGTGEEVTGNANFTPWLIAPAPSGACGNTPGKATGGGQIESDPVFSPLGDLVSLPALMVTSSNPSGRATFGFVARCCAPSGNLDYKDHAEDVRIKATSVDGFNISPSGFCAGGKHAQFVGDASVIRSNGTTTERYTVDVDDCGEPGTSDRFGIKTTSYANGPSVLLGGNIQIKQ